ncbi:MAG TPA: hypothetical protein VGI00_24995 [Streptosporangiaceae bacterium]|jgi:hypothetical protein
MFDPVAEHWKQYLSQVSDGWPESDPRHSLGGEVSGRLRQLDRILAHLHDAIGATKPDPIEAQQKMQWRRDNHHRLTSGEITQEEFIQGSITTTPDPMTLIDNWDDVEIFTEAFYFCAWRMIEVLNGSGPYSFPKLHKVKANAVTIVRNHLIQHPEKVKEGQNFTLGLVVLDSGPVLRSLGAVAHGDTGQIDPLPESKDQGLFVAADELRADLLSCLDQALSQLQS